ncbi:hypothetical protein ACFFQW_48145 [Umezawaea endophytica]|uniref:Uncharacterized protein n=1 Tax=Umezawaea endophytica TaxID=1654476 RepID=A0A9X3AL00_9PSEU|nr:hypothetical protein [Umezawaea endophytica]MCS7483675.1 hypothetical protein [Umezawaea endophytica]
MGEIAKRNSTSDRMSKPAKLAELATSLERKAALIHQEARVDMKISEILAEAEVEQDRLERE